MNKDLVDAPNEISNLDNLREQIRKLHLRSNTANDSVNPVSHLKMISSLKNDIKTTTGGLKYNINLTHKKGQKIEKFLSKSPKRKTQSKHHDEFALHENMVPYKFFKSSRYVLINKEGELLQEETEALRAQLFPHMNQQDENGKL